MIHARKVAQVAKHETNQECGVLGNFLKNEEHFISRQKQSGAFRDIFTWTKFLKVGNNTGVV